MGRARAAHTHAPLHAGGAMPKEQRLQQIGTAAAAGVAVGAIHYARSEELLHALNQGALWDSANTGLHLHRKERKRTCAGRR